MPVNDNIREADYNSIRNKLASVIGTGSATLGWGQPLVSTAVEVGSTVSINEWGRLRFDSINAHRHIFGTTPTTAQPALGNTIRYSNTFVPDNSSDAPITQYDTYANSITSNRFTVHPSQSATAVSSSGSTAWPGPYGATWTSRIQCTVTASWPTAEQARHFFNSGGEIRLAASRTGGSGTQQNNSWTTILSNAGTRAFGGNLPTAGTSSLDGRNFYRCTNTYQEWYSTTGSTPYGSNIYRIFARTPSVANNSTGTSLNVQFLVDFVDNYVDPGTGGFPDTVDAVDGTFTVSTSYLYATGVLEPSGTGNFTVQQPSISVGTIAPA
jgi:hypothetical protein